MERIPDDLAVVCALMWMSGATVTEMLNRAYTAGVAEGLLQAIERAAGESACRCPEGVHRLGCPGEHR
jgi:hypothetical protein